MTPKQKAVFLVYDQVNAIDVAGPSEAFAAISHPHGGHAYEIVSWAADEVIVRTESGIRICADRKLPTKPKADILIIPGGKGIRDPKTLSLLSNWLKKHHANFDRFYNVGKSRARSLDMPFNWKLKIVPKADHDFEIMSRAAADYLYAK